VPKLFNKKRVIGTTIKPAKDAALNRSETSINTLEV
jgi:hypothetical protein